MKKILVTGAAGFIGQNLVNALTRRDDVSIDTYTSEMSFGDLETKLRDADVVYHLAGVNRPKNPDDFAEINVGLTRRIVEILSNRSGNLPLVVLSSSAQAALDNDYGRSKAAAEQVLVDAAEGGALRACIYRLPGVFGKWSRPNYNTVVATFCHHIARDEPITVSNPDHELMLVYVDDVVRCLLSHLDSAGEPLALDNCDVEEVHRVTLGELETIVRSFREIRNTFKVPSFADRLTRNLYTTYLSFLPEDGFAYPVVTRSDDRGWLFELIKSDSFGQIFVSTTHPGITRGNHYHDSKVEKFCVVKGQGMIRFRKLDSTEVIQCAVDDSQIQIVDIPPGYTHSIENTGTAEMITLFWANEVFDPDRPDTYWVEV